MAKKPVGGEPALNFDNREDLEAWLKTQPREVAVAIAARAAQRALPFVTSYITAKDGAERTRRLSFNAAVFRATALARATSKYPIHAAELGSAAANAVEAVSAVERGKFGGVKSPEARAAAASALAVIANSAHRAAFAVEWAADEASPFALSAGLTTIWRAASQDASFIASGRLAEMLASLSLWPQGTPRWIDEHWTRLSGALPRKDDWQVWIDWY